MKSNHNTSSYISIKYLVLKSGIFKTKSVNKSEIPLGVYKLYGEKQLSKEKIIPNVKVTTLVSQLARIISQYELLPEDNKEEMISEILADFEKYLSKYGINKEEAREIGKKYKIRQRIINTGALEQDKKTEKRYYGLLLPVFQIFQKHLNTNQDDTYRYMAYFLVGCKIEKPTVNQTYDRISQFIKRYERGRSWANLKTYRKKPDDIKLKTQPPKPTT